MGGASEEATADGQKQVIAPTRTTRRLAGLLLIAVGVLMVQVTFWIAPESPTVVTICGGPDCPGENYVPPFMWPMLLGVFAIVAGAVAVFKKTR